MPPPNANGSLHIGHVVFVTLEDIMTRYHRMKGQPTLWLPGADHAGFETQVVFEKKLEKKKQSRFHFERKKLYKMMWDFTQENKIRMENQLRKLGASCDWSREKFTLDKDIIKIVYQTFEKMHKDGLLYRDLRPVNWCTKHQTSLSELEVKYTQQTDPLYYIKYPIATSNKRPAPRQGGQVTSNKLRAISYKLQATSYITVATTRPETMFADVAIAVNPKDKKYKNFIGKKVLLPLTNRKIPIIADSEVDPKFGTGALKITPAHDPIDFEIGKRHKLEVLTAIDKYGKLTNLCGEFQGLKIVKAREKVVEKLKKEGFISKIKDNYEHTVGHCYKCNRIIEPRILLQWFVKMKPLAKMGLDAVSSNKVKFVSKKFEKIYRHWLTNIRDWNISRQIVWGIQIPAYYCRKCDNVMIDINRKPVKCSKCKSTDIYQDPDVFDTWFSSGQWPFATLMTNRKGDFKKFYPTSVMETAWDILFFWVARMIMLGLYQTGKVPFKTVYIHGLVRDKDRQKMSKSKGNVIDPLAVATEYGSDAVRMALVFGTGTGNDTSISEDKIRAMRNFTTKIWNASRFVLIALTDTQITTGTNTKQHKFNPSSRNLQFHYGASNLTMKQCSNLTITKSDKKILSELDKTITETTKYIESYRFGPAAEKLYDFFWHDFCDIYLEESKKQLQDPKLKQNTQKLLLFTLTQSLTLLHPFMPFITEEIYQKLRATSYTLRAKSIMVSDWPNSIKVKNG